MSCVRWFNDNFTSADVVSTFSVSSEQAAFPKENLQDQQRRSKVWRSNGYWEVASGSNTIAFKETSGGGTLTATIAAANYNSDTTFFAAVKAALEGATGAGSTYTVARDATTSRIKITSDGAGGTGDFELLFATSTAVADLLGFDQSNITGALTYTADLLVLHSPDEWIEWDFGISTNPEALIVTGKRNSFLPLSPNAVVKLQGNETNTWSAPTYDQTLTLTDDKVIVKLNEGGLHTEALRFWRFSIADSDNPNTYIELGAVFLGDWYEPTTGSPQFGWTEKEVDRTETVFSEGGQTFSDVRPKSAEFSFDYKALTKTEKESLHDIFDTYGTGIPFFIQFDPNAVFHSTSDLSVKYVKFASPPNFKLDRPNQYSCQITLREEL